MTLLVIHFLQIARISMTSIDIVATIYGLILYSPQSFIQADSAICECIQINSRLMECRKPKHLTPFSLVRTDTIAANEKNLKQLYLKQYATLCGTMKGGGEVQDQGYINSGEHNNHRPYFTARQPFGRAAMGQQIVCAQGWRQGVL